MSTMMMIIKKKKVHDKKYGSGSCGSSEGEDDDEDNGDNLDDVDVVFQKQYDLLTAMFPQKVKTVNSCRLYSNIYQ